MFAQQLQQPLADFGFPPKLPSPEPRGLQFAADFRHASFHGQTPRGPIWPVHRGSLVGYAPTAEGWGALFSGGSSTGRAIGWRVREAPAVSLEFRFRTQATFATSRLGTFSDGADGTSATFDKMVSFDPSSRLTFYIFASGGLTLTDTGTAFAGNTIYHVVCTADGTNMKIFVNGRETASQSAGLSFGAFGTPHLTVGSVRSQGTQVTMLYAGYADVAWTPAEIMNRYLDTFGFLTEPSGLWGATPPNPILRSSMMHMFLG